MNFALHQRSEQRYRSAKIAVGAVMGWRCKCCGRARYQMAGRKKALGGGWICADCVK